MSESITPTLADPLGMGSTTPPVKALNIAHPGSGEIEVTTTHPDPTPPQLHIHFDIESLDLGPRPIITQVAMFALDLDEDVILERKHYEFYPVQPQLRLPTPRTFAFDTLVWWMDQSKEARDRLRQSSSNEDEEIPALLRHLVTTFNKMTNGGKIPYEIWARGPQFDLVAIESLMADYGLTPPWEYNKVRDLRTLLALAGINSRNIGKPAGFVGHAANWDVRYQIDQYRVSIKKLRS